MKFIPIKEDAVERLVMLSIPGETFELYADGIPLKSKMNVKASDRLCCV